MSFLVAVDIRTFCEIVIKCIRQIIDGILVHEYTEFKRIHVRIVVSSANSIKSRTFRRVYHIVPYLQVGVYHIVAYHYRNFIRKWASGICRVRKLYRI